MNTRSESVKGKAHGAQNTRHIIKIGEYLGAAQRSHWLSH